MDRSRRCPDRIVVGFTTTCAYHHKSCEFESHSGEVGQWLISDRSVVFSVYNTIKTLFRWHHWITLRCTIACVRRVSGIVFIRYGQSKKAVKPINLKYFYNKKKDLNGLATNGKCQKKKKKTVSLIIKSNVNVNNKHIKYTVPLPKYWILGERYP